MSRFIARLIRLIAFIGVVAGTVFLGYEYLQNSESSSVVETVKATAETSAQWTEEHTVEARKAWQKLDVDRKISDFQDKTKPIGRKITAAVGPMVTPNMQPVEKGERRMSLPALLLILVFGMVFVLMGRTSSGAGRY